MSRVCIVPGTYDPITVGHFDLIARAAKLFDKVYVTAFNNSAKQTMFTAEERFEMLKLVCREIPNAVPDMTDVLMIDYARGIGAGYIVKGVRGALDFDYEYQLSMISRELSDDIETILLPAKAEQSFISSTFVKEMLRYNRDIERYVPYPVAEYISALG